MPSECGAAAILSRIPFIGGAALVEPRVVLPAFQFADIRLPAVVAVEKYAVDQGIYSGLTKTGTALPRLAVLFVLSAASSPCPDLNLIHYKIFQRVLGCWASRAPR
ncbi:hypothetical protein ICR70_001503 [Neisseria gonorrhoeae]